MPTYNPQSFLLYILPPIPKGGWLYELRIRRGLPTDGSSGYFAAASDTLLLDASTRVLSDKSFGKIVKAFNNEDGLMTGDGVDISLLDPFKYSGVSNGVAVSEDLRQYQKSLGWNIFERDSSIKVYTVWITKRRKITKGVYSGSTAYSVGDIVADSNNMPWKCLTAGSGNALVEGANWTRAYNIFFGGDFGPADISWPGTGIVNPMQSTEIVRRNMQWKAKPGIERFKNCYVGDLIGAVPATYSNAVLGYSAITSGDCARSTNDYPFYAGLATKDNDSSDYHFSWQGEQVDVFDLGGWTKCIHGDTGRPGTDFVEMAAYYRYEASRYDSSFPHGVWGITAGTVLSKVAQAVGLGFNPSTDLTSAFTFYPQIYDETTRSYHCGNQQIASGDTSQKILPKNLVECFNTLFCVNWTNQLTVGGVANTTITSPFPAEAEMQNPFGYAWNTPLTELIKQYCWDFGARAFYSLDQGTSTAETGRLHLRILSRRDSQGTLPTALKMKKNFKRDPATLAKQYVEITNKGADGAMQCPPKVSSFDQAIQIKLAHRVHAMGRINQAVGNTTTYDIGHLTYDSKEQIQDQDHASRMHDGAQTNQVWSNGWITGAHWFEMEQINPSSPPIIGPTSLDGAACLANGATGHWAGFYGIGVVTENTSMTCDLSKRTDNYFAPAQFYSRELITTERPWTRECKGIASYAGDLDTLGPGVEASWPAPDGVDADAANPLTLTTFRANSVEIDILADNVSFKFIRKPDYNSYADQPYFMDTGTSGNSGAATTSSSTSGNVNATTIPAGTIIQTPTTATQNTITPSTDIVGLTHKALAGQTANFEEWKNSSGVTLGKMDVNGRFTTKDLTVSNLATGALTSSSGAVSSVALTNGQVLIGSTGSTPVASALTAGSGISITNGAGTITIACTLSAGVVSFNSRTGAVLPQTGDYTAAMVTNAVDSTNSYANPTWIASLDWTKITNVLTSAPTSSAVNTIHPSNTSTVPLTIQQTGGTVDVFVVTDSLSNSYFKVDFQGIPTFAKKIVATAGMTINGGGSASTLDISGSFGTQWITVTGTHTVVSTDHSIRADATGGAFSIILPTASTCNGREICVKRINSGTNNITVVGTIDGITNKVLTAQWQSVRVKSTGSTWETV